MGIYRCRCAAVLGVIALLMAPSLNARSPVDVKLAPEASKYCHVVNFTMDWGPIKPLDERSFPPIFEYESDYEFRVAGLLETTFMVRGFDQVSQHYTAKAFEVDLSDPKAIARPIRDEKWQAGTVLPFTQTRTRTSGPDLPRGDTVMFNGYEFRKSGIQWSISPDEALLSPDRSWIVLRSWSGTLSHSDDIPGGLEFGESRGQLFFDIFNTDTGRKVVTIVGSYVDIHPSEAIGKAGWLTERYFMVPLGEHRERCLVCEFGQGPR